MLSASQILWRCRRGIREMDLLLQQFVERYYSQLSTQEKHDFERLLDEADLDIMDWIMGRRTPPSDNYANLIQMINSSVNPSFKDD